MKERRNKKENFSKMAGGLGLEPNSHLKIEGRVHNEGGKTKMTRGTKVSMSAHIIPSYLL